MALHDRSRDLPDGRRQMPSMRLSLFLAAVAAIVFVLGIYAVTRVVGPDANDTLSMAQPATPRPALAR